MCYGSSRQYFYIYIQAQAIRAHVIIHHPYRRLVLAAWCSWNITRLWVSSTLFSSSTLNHHLLEVHIWKNRILVTWLTRVDSTCIRRVTLESLKWVEVGSRARCARIPRVV